MIIQIILIMMILENVVLFNKIDLFYLYIMKFCCYTIYNNNNKKCNKCRKKLKKIYKYNIINKLPSDILQLIISFYIKSKYMFYYINLQFVSKSWHLNFNTFLYTQKFLSYNNILKNKNKYFITSIYYNIKFAKLYISKDINKYNILFGNENIDLASHKIKLDTKYISIQNFKYLKFLTF